MPASNHEPSPGPLRPDEIVVVSGLPRSGTSMMMAMLAAGGIPLATDGAREADADNPRGYFELEAVKRLPEDASWLAGCAGKAVKIISHLLKHLPADHAYRVILMDRDLDEVIASQASMLRRRGKPHHPEEDAALMGMYGRHMAEVREWLEGRPDLVWLPLDYGGVVADPKSATAELARFLGPDFGAERAAAQVDPALHRRKRPQAE